MINWLDWGYPILLWFQGLGESWLVPMQAFTALGNEYFFLLVMPALLWCYDIWLGIEVGGLLLFSSGLNAIVKMAVALPRPYWASAAVRAFGGGNEFGFPSGHAQNALVMWGQLAVRLRRRWTTWLCIALIFLISISRWYLGLHFPLDTFGGWLLGLAILALYSLFRKPFTAWLTARSLVVQLGLCLVAALLFAAAGWGIASLRNAPADLPLWEAAARAAVPGSETIHPFDPAPVFTSAGAWFGLMAGGLLLHAWNGYIMKGSPLQFMLRILIGIAGLLALYLGLKSIFPADESLFAYALRALRYGLLGFWISYLAPRLFTRLRLYQPAD